MNYSVILAIVAFSWLAHAQETPSFETVIEDTTFNTSSRIIIDEKAIKESRAPNITSLLSAQANITVVNTPMQPNSIFIRGGDSGHILILVDGVPFYDAGTTQRTFNLNSLDVKSVRRIEVLKGAQTVLYGGQALNGVIKIETIPQELATRTGLQGQIGTQNQRDLTAVHLQETLQNQALVLRGHGAWKDNSSPLLDSSKKYPANNWNSEAAYVWKGAFDGVVKMNYLQDHGEAASMNGTDTDGYEVFNRQTAASANLRFHETAWRPRLAVSTQNSLRKYDQPVNATNTTLIQQEYLSDLQTLRLDATPWKSELLQITTGGSYIHEKLAQRDLGVEEVNRAEEQRGLFVKVDLNRFKNVEFSIGGRVESWGDREPVSTYQVGLTLFKKTKLEVASGYKIPSLFHLYSPDYGNPNIKEERAIQYSLTQDFEISERQNLSITLFHYSFSDLIVAQMVTPPGTPGFPYGAYQYRNINKSETRGAEAVYTFVPSDSSTLFFSYGYQEPRNQDTDTWLARRPLVNGSIKYLHTWNKHSGSLEVVGAGERVDSTRIGNATVAVTLPGYAIANASYSYSLQDNFTIYTRLNNLLNNRYQELYGYHTEGFSGLVGAEYWF